MMMMMTRKNEKKTLSLPFIIYLTLCSCCGFLMIVSHNQLANYRFYHSAGWSLRAQTTLFWPHCSRVPHRESDNLSQANSSLWFLIIYLPFGFEVLGLGYLDFGLLQGQVVTDSPLSASPECQDSIIMLMHILKRNCAMPTIYILWIITPFLQPAQVLLY